MSATSGTSGTRRRISLSATAASTFGTATRTISQPARIISRICPTVPSTSAVSVFVMDCTETGAPPPICKSLTLTARVSLISSKFKVPSSRFKVARPGTLSLELGTWNSFLLRRRGPFGAEPAGREFRHVVDDDEAHQEEQEDEADLLDALAHTHRELHADDAEQGFQKKHEDHAAVEDGDGQEIGR